MRQINKPSKFNFSKKNIKSIASNPNNAIDTSTASPIKVVAQKPKVLFSSQDVLNKKASNNKCITANIETSPRIVVNRESNARVGDMKGMHILNFP